MRGRCDVDVCGDVYDKGGLMMSVSHVRPAALHPSPLCWFCRR